MTVRTVLLLAATAAASWAPLPAHAAAGPTCGGLPATIVGTPGRDVIVGTTGPDVIAALAGDDVVRAGGGDDVVCGGPGHDQLRSNRGRDTYYGGPGGDRIDGRSILPTRVFGGAGDDLLVLEITDEPGYLIDGGTGRDIGEIGLHSDATDLTGVTVDQKHQVFVRAGEQTGVVRGLEDVGLDDQVPYVYYGTRRPDWVSVPNGVLAFHAWTYGGDDRIFSSDGDDVLDAGRGDDEVSANAGNDVCRSAERRHGCEIKS